MPRRAPFDFRNFERTEGKVLGFTAQFEGENVTPPDDERRFVVSYYLVDGSVAVYEPPVVNSGFIGGKVLERTMAPVKKPGSRAPYVAKDLGGRGDRTELQEVPAPRHRRRHGKNNQRTARRG